MAAVPQLPASLGLPAALQQFSQHSPAALGTMLGQAASPGPSSSGLLPDQEQLNDLGQLARLKYNVPVSLYVMQRLNVESLTSVQELHDFLQDSEPGHIKTVIQQVIANEGKVWNGPTPLLAEKALTYIFEYAKVNNELKSEDKQAYLEKFGPQHSETQGQAAPATAPTGDTDVGPGTAASESQGLICPRCSKLRGRKGWRKSQWDASSPTIYPYDGCRQCHDSGPSQQRVQDLIVIRDLLDLEIAEFQEGQADFLWTMKQMYTSDYIEGSSKDQATFFRTMKKKLRNFGDWKSLSSNGGLPAVYEFHPKHWKDYMGNWYFDPSNYVYAKAIRLACPSFIDTSGCTNCETLVDCIEAVLGLEWALTSQSQTGESYELLRTRWPGSGISVARAARFWRIISTHLFYIEWVEGMLSDSE